MIKLMITIGLPEEKLLSVLNMFPPSKLSLKLLLLPAKLLLLLFEFERLLFLHGARPESFPLPLLILLLLLLEGVQGASGYGRS